MSNEVPAAVPATSGDRQAPSGPVDSTARRRPGLLIRGVNRRAWQITLLSLGGWLLVNMDGSLFNLNYPLLQEDLGLSDNDIGNLYAIIYAVGAISTIISGPFMDRFGRKPVFQLCMFAAALGSLVTAGAGGFMILLLGRAITQAGATTEWMAGQVMVAEESPARSRGRLIGFAQIGYPLGFFAGSLLSWLIVPNFGWRWLFVVGVIPIFLLLWARRGVDETERFRLHSEAVTTTSSPAPGRFRQLFAADLRRSSILASTWHLVYAFGVAGILSYLPLVYTHYGVSMENLYVSSAIATGIAAVGYYLSSVVGDRIGRREAAALWLILGAGSGALLAFAGRDVIALTIFYSMVYFFTLGHITAAAGFAAEVFPTRVRATGANLVAGMEWVGFVAAGLAGPRMFNGIGFAWTLTIWLVICPLIAAACALGMKRVAPGATLEEIAR
ncbi:MFS transporter [Gordonia desulfuricans]|uniref:MFS transporter n=1 Tax=Gordonia desulfuricans TaxID=89051 RepID=A0A7K3LKR2_9ACTN|nr:MFS transporter [Gordonia desulfuricans]NDK88798.1 MFS transporter [Gordonia desulfuricans]